MAASSSSSSIWKTQVWAPPITEFCEVKKCAYCGSEASEKKCKGCSELGYTVIFCDATCQQNAWPTHQYICKTGRAEAFLERFTHPDNLSVGMTLTCLAEGIIASVKLEVEETENSLTNAFSSRFDSIRRDRVVFEDSTRKDFKFENESMKIRGSLVLGAEKHMSVIDSCDPMNMLLSEDLIIMFSATALLFRPSDKSLSGEIMAMTLCLYNHILYNETESKTTFAGLIAERIEDNPDYTIVESEVPFTFEEFVASMEINRCHLYFFIIEDLDDEGAVLDKQMIALLHFDDQYCIVQANKYAYTYAQWCNWSEPLVRNPNSSSQLHHVLSQPRFRGWWTGKSALGDFFNALKSLTNEGEHRATYADITGLFRSENYQHRIRGARFSLADVFLV